MKYKFFKKKSDVTVQQNLTVLNFRYRYKWREKLFFLDPALFCSESGSGKNERADTGK